MTQAKPFQTDEWVALFKQAFEILQIGRIECRVEDNTPLFTSLALQGCLALRSGEPIEFVECLFDGRRNPLPASQDHGERQTEQTNRSDRYAHGMTLFFISGLNSWSGCSAKASALDQPREVRR